MKFHSMSTIFYALADNSVDMHELLFRNIPCDTIQLVLTAVSGDRVLFDIQYVRTYLRVSP